MKVVTTVKKGWLAQSNRAQLTWPSFDASRKEGLILRVSHGFDRYVLPSCVRKTPIMSQEGHLKHFSQGGIRGVIGTEIAMQQKPQAKPKRRSPAIALGAHGVRRIDGQRDGRPACQSRPQFLDRRPLGHIEELLQQVLG